MPIFPAPDQRQIYSANGYILGEAKYRVYTDAGATVAATIYVNNNGVRGAVIANAEVTSNHLGQIPTFIAHPAGSLYGKPVGHAGPIIQLQPDVSMPVDGTATQSALTALEADLAVVGEYAPRRELINSNAGAAASQTLMLTYFTARRTETINNMYIMSGGTAAAATPTICRMGVFSVADNGDITPLASIANDTSLFSATNTEYTRALTTPFAKVAGVRYACGVLVVTAVAAPSFHSHSFPATAPPNTFGRDNPALVGRVTGQAAWPTATILNASIVGFQHRIAFKLIP